MYTKKSEFLAEIIGSMFIALFGCGVVASVVVGNNGAPINIHIAWGLAVTFGIYASGKISGAHLNPAVTLALAVTGRFQWSKVWYYIVAQMIGFFIGAAIVFAVYYGKWIEVDPNFENTAGVFATFPAVPGFLYGFIDQVVGTFILIFLILATGDANNTPAGANLGPIIVGLIIVAIGMSFGFMHGYAINPARDLGPRLFAVLVGFKNNGLTDGSNVWIVPIVGPIVGGIFGAIVYDVTIGNIFSKK
ncbi:glycerol uptake facilitator protein [Brachyspira pilosicoli WesB]|uniref:Glycerol uptake facilitator protein n=2 Tax=Brachyspira pilosicoli TaxID=52584 RepID=K0JKM2_BRAPL|nr:MIP/aquaporin family protein [Brachyspira pilosicoli]MBW5377543.1 aquaporin family protein [Brachyspira pilosicoli]WIH85625.1 aquaporin family protein [Brachyspira pilosicoli]WIH90166.1 aquaporin family protein [Brachyspira pilosicoli]WIH92457.1 aquaporin family protein [Brachyspira pilosicoli]WIH94749.1 aquaporin family protein [Brachyspira pilosicoli]